MNGLALARPGPAPPRALAPCARSFTDARIPRPIPHTRSPTLRRLPRTRPLSRVRARARPQRTGPGGRPYWLSDSPKPQTLVGGGRGLSGGAGRERGGRRGPGGRRSRPRAQGARSHAPLCARASRTLLDGAGWPRAWGVCGRANFSVRAGAGVSARGSCAPSRAPACCPWPLRTRGARIPGGLFSLISEPPHVRGAAF